MADWTAASTLGLRSAVVAGLAGFLARPCCVLPAVLALGGTTSAALTQSVAAHRPVFLAASVLLLAGSFWMNVRSQTRPLNKWLAVVAAAASFAFVGGFGAVLEHLVRRLYGVSTG